MANLPTGFRTPKLRLPRRRVDTASIAEDDLDEDELEIRISGKRRTSEEELEPDDIAEQDEELELEEETDAELENELIEEDEMEEESEDLFVKTPTDKQNERQESAKPPHFKVKNKRSSRGHDPA